MALKTVLCFRINGKEYTYDEMPKEKAIEIIKEKVDLASSGLPFEREKSA